MRFEDGKLFELRPESVVEEFLNIDFGRELKDSVNLQGRGDVMVFKDALNEGEEVFLSSYTNDIEFSNLFMRINQKRVVPRGNKNFSNYLYFYYCKVNMLIKNIEVDAEGGLNVELNDSSKFYVHGKNI